jgi:hypothetical protein
MNRDMDLIRRIALAAADAPHGTILQSLNGVDEADFSLHVEWMEEAGLVKAYIGESMAGPKSAAIFRLTWDGCEFVDAVRSETLWKKAKTNVIKPGMSFTFGVLRDWLKAEIAQGLPTLGGGA